MRPPASGSGAPEAIPQVYFAAGAEAAGSILEKGPAAVCGVCDLVQRLFGAAICPLPPIVRLAADPRNAADRKAFNMGADVLRARQPDAVPVINHVLQGRMR